MAEAILAAAAADQEADECSVCVAVHVRPLIDSELLEGCDSLLVTTPQQPQVCLADLLLTFGQFKLTGDLLSQLLYRSPLEPIALLMTTYSEQKALPLSSSMVIALNLLLVAFLKVTMQQV